MGLNPAHRFDGARRAKRETEQIRQLRKRPHGHCEGKTYVQRGGIDVTTWLPPVFVGLDPDNTIPEVKSLYELGGMLYSGTLDVHWELNGTTIPGSDYTITADPADAVTVLATPVALAHRDRLQIVVDSSSSGTNLAAVYYLVTRQA